MALLIITHNECNPNCNWSYPGFILAYRYYYGFVITRVAMLNANRITPANRLFDNQNYYPMNKWVLFGHHFAASAGADPLVGSVLAIQFGYMPDLLWILIGALMAGGMHDLIILVAMHWLVLEPHQKCYPANWI